MFWVLEFKQQNASARDWRRAFDTLVGRIIASAGVTLFNAVEAGVPTYLVYVIAGATGGAPRCCHLSCSTALRATHDA